MAEQGRILHHLRNNIEDPRNTVLITGFAAVDTLGRKLVDGQKDVRIFGEPVRVRAEISSLDELSGHADQGELLAWLKPFVKPIKKIFLVHGEPEQSATLAQVIQKEYGVETIVPKPQDSFSLT
jgi:metallo-beta-lactamase family protein